MPALANLVDEGLEADALSRAFRTAVKERQGGRLSEISSYGCKERRGSRPHHAVDARGADDTSGSPPEKIDCLGHNLQYKIAGPRSDIWLRQSNQLVNRWFDGYPHDLLGKAAHQTIPNA